MHTDGHVHGTQREGRVMKPVLGITMGDAAGIGPELILKAFRTAALYERCRPLVIGSMAVMERYRGLCESTLRFRPVGDPSQAEYRPGTLDILDLGLVDVAKLQIGVVAAEPGN